MTQTMIQTTTHRPKKFKTDSEKVGNCDRRKCGSLVFPIWSINFGFAEGMNPKKNFCQTQNLSKPVSAKEKAKSTIKIRH